MKIDFPLELFQSKWQRRFEPEADDWKPAPGTRSGLAWDNLDDGLIPWGAMKSAWRRFDLGICSNCDHPTFLTNFGLRHFSLYNRYPFEVEVCGKCGKQFCSEPLVNKELDADWRPKYGLIQGKRVAISNLSISKVSDERKWLRYLRAPCYSDWG
jgi:hypothetical protein